ncbi:MAG: glycosyltransferase family A protein [Pirellulales bacterium]
MSAHQTTDRVAIHESSDHRVGVVIPVYNRRTILLETLEHVLGQSYLPASLVIVDDGSTDGTAASAEKYLALALPQFAWEVVRAPHQTAANARNIGLERVRSLPLVAFLDSDDHWPPDFLQRAVASLAANPSAVAAVADRKIVGPTGPTNEQSDCRGIADNAVAWFFRHGGGVASCSLLRTATVLAAGRWNASLEAAEDSALFCEIALLGEWVHVPSAPVVFHRGTGELRQEENNLSARHADRHLGWAQAYEQIYASVSARVPESSHSELQRALAARWYSAGKQLMRLGRSEEGGQCFARALHWRPMMFQAWRQIAMCGPTVWQAAISRSDGPAVSRGRAA